MFYVIEYEQDGKTLEQTVQPHEDVIQFIENILSRGGKITGLKRKYNVMD